ncbi:hypothetical protein ACXHMN_29075 [Rhizobium sp. LEGMi12c]
MIALQPLIVYGAELARVYRLQAVQAFAFLRIFAYEIVTSVRAITPVSAMVKGFWGASGLSNAAWDFDANADECAVVFTEL